MSSTNHQMDINTKKNKERSLNSSPNSSRDLSIYSDTSSMKYAERIKAQSNSAMQADQINNESLLLPILSYTTAKEETDDNSDLDLTNESICITTTDNMCVPQENHSTPQAPQSTEPSVISYIVN